MNMSSVSEKVTSDLLPQPDEPHFTITSTREVRNGKGKSIAGKILPHYRISLESNEYSSNAGTLTQQHSLVKTEQDAAGPHQSAAAPAVSNPSTAQAGPPSPTHSFGSGLSSPRHIPSEVPDQHLYVQVEDSHPPSNAPQLLKLLEAFRELPHKASIDRNSGKKIRQFLSGEREDADGFVVAACNQLSRLQQRHGEKGNVPAMAEEFQLHMFGKRDAGRSKARGQRRRAMKDKKAMKDKRAPAGQEPSKSPGVCRKRFWRSCRGPIEE